MRFWLLASSALLIAACEGEVTDGGTGSDTDYEELEEQAGGDGMTEAEEEAASDRVYSTDEVANPGDPRIGDYPTEAEETTRNPIKPGAEEPGGKDMMLEEERRALDVEGENVRKLDVEVEESLDLEGEDPVVLEDEDEDPGR